MSLLEPISKEQPCGINIKDNDEYLSIEIEMEKSFNLSGNNDIDWKQISDNCESLLQKETKDLKLASYWLYAQWNLTHASGLIDHFELFVDFMEKFGAEMFPDAPRRRTKILEWTENVMERPFSNAIPIADIDECELWVLDIDRHNKIIKTLSPDIGTMYKKIAESAKNRADELRFAQESAQKQEELLKAEEEKRREEEGKINKEKEKQEAENRKLIAKFEFDENNNMPLDPDVETDHSIYSESNAELAKIAERILEDNPVDTIGYSIILSIAASKCKTGSPDAISESDMVPSDIIVKAANGLINMKSISRDQLSALVEQLVKYPLWIQGHYILIQILYKIGLSDIALKIENLLLVFLIEYPEILEQNNPSMVNIDEEIKKWINAKMHSSTSKTGNDTEYQTVYQEALRINNEQGAKQALGVLEEHFRQSASSEAKFEWRLLMVDLLLEIGEKPLAVSLLLDLEKQIESFHIDIWRPDLAIKTYDKMIKPMLTQDLGDHVKERIYHKLSILDIQKVVSS